MKYKIEREIDINDSIFNAMISSAILISSVNPSPANTCMKKMVYELNFLKIIGEE